MFTYNIQYTAQYKPDKHTLLKKPLKKSYIISLRKVSLVK